MSISQQSAPIYQHPVVDFNWIADGWRGFIQRPWIWVGATFLAGAILGAVYLLLMAPTAFFIMGHVPNKTGPTAPPYGLIAILYAVWFIVIFGVITASFVFIGGMFRMAHRQLQGEDIGVLDFFSVGDSLSALVSMGLLYMASSLVGAIGCGIPSLVVHGVFMFAPLIVVTQRVSAIEACRRSFRMLREQWFMASVFALVLWLLYSFSGMLFGVGMFVAGPVAVMAITSGYYRLGGTAEPNAFAFDSAQAGVWPPPPGPAVGDSGQASQVGWYGPPPPGGSAHLPGSPYGYNGTVAAPQNAANPDEAASPNGRANPAAYASKENEDADGSTHESV